MSNHKFTPKLEYLQTLKQIAPAIALSVSRTHDENFVWDGDGPDPVDDGYLPFDVDVKARSIVQGEILEGSQSLGGSYFAPDEPIGDCHGYLPQMLEEAIADLLKQPAIENQSAIWHQGRQAQDFLRRLMREQYEAQRKKANRQPVNP
jgi:hypothetical protein